MKKNKPKELTPKILDLKKEDIEKELNENPEIELVGIGSYRIPNTKQLVAYKMKTKGKMVVSLEIEHPPDLKPIVIDHLKVSLVHEFMSEEFLQ